MYIEGASRQQIEAVDRFNEAQHAKKIQRILEGNMAVRAGSTPTHTALVVLLPTDSSDKATLHAFLKKEAVEGSNVKFTETVSDVRTAAEYVSGVTHQPEFLMFADFEREGQTAFVLNKKLVERMMQGNELPHDPDLAAALCIRVPSVAAARR